MIKPGQVWGCQLSLGNFVTIATIEGFTEKDGLGLHDVWRCLIIEYTRSPDSEGQIARYDAAFLKRYFKRMA